MTYSELIQVELPLVKTLQKLGWEYIPSAELVEFRPSFDDPFIIPHLQDVIVRLNGDKGINTGHASAIIHKLKRLESNEEFSKCVQKVFVDLGIKVKTVNLNDNNIRGVAFVGTSHSPTILINKGNPSNSTQCGQRFTLAHELCHLLHDRAVGKPLAMTSGPWAPRGIEKRANAFAAMFLMPSSIIEKVISKRNIKLNPWKSSRELKSNIRRLAIAMRTSEKATFEHLHNLRFIDEVVYNKLGGYTSR